MTTDDKRKARRAEQARLRSVTNTRPKTKSPSKLRRLERRAAARAAGVTKPERRSIFQAKPDPRHVSKRQKTAIVLKNLHKKAAEVRKPLEEMNKAELTNLAREANIKGRSKMDKQQLVAALAAPRNPDDR